MDRDAVIGCVILVCAMGVITYLTFWSRRTINWIAENGHRSAREIMKNINGRR